VKVLCVCLYKHFGFSQLIFMAFSPKTAINMLDSRGEPKLLMVLSLKGKSENDAVLAVLRQRP
jgi:hypothetical protein